MRRVLAIAGLAALIAGCGATTKVAQTAVPTTLAGAQGRQSASPKTQGPLIAMGALSATLQPPALPAGPKGRCDAPSLAYLVGRPRTEIPVPADLSHRRVACTTCPGTDDYHADRTDILFNAATGIVTAVTCG